MSSDQKAALSNSDINIRALKSNAGNLKRQSTARSNEVQGGKFELRIELKRMDIKVDKTSLFRAQMRCPEVFKVMSKKKYKLESPFGDQNKQFEGEIEFTDDFLSKVTLVPFNKETSEFKQKIVMLEILDDQSNVCGGVQIDLKDFAS